ncbi:DUF19 domain-containing protein [Caenorhabditis elegans]|uniref:DUF19 domain-containing protein n=1 Tax=Caenorhabditis elegans TaxID=6239 RepID=Q09EF1_CAEEL|nr:DUF19 domain-containing protein [Caenorhabditis elegans]CAL44971.2 DUF19 domain-containing protein [Caenorhabditis elegans]|eukprot:NP_001255509.1 Uncharacterized protein CELE_T25B9.11 [Caenorhabditis elegans]
MMIRFLILLILFCSCRKASAQSGLTAYESIRRLRECIDVIDKPEFKRTCEEKFGEERDECIEKFTKKIMPTLNACIVNSRESIVTIPNREEL